MVDIHCNNSLPCQDRFQAPYHFAGEPEAFGDAEDVFAQAEEEDAFGDTSDIAWEPPGQ